MACGVVIVAADAFTALAPDLRGTWLGLLAGRGAVAPVRGFRPEEVGAATAAQAGEPPPREPSTGPSVVTPHGTVLEHLARSVHDGARAGDLPREEVGFHVGLGMVDSDPDALAPAIAASRDRDGRFDLERFFAGGFRAMHPHWPLRMLNNVAVGQVAADLDLRGDNLVLAAEADAGARAVAEGVAAIDAGAVRASVVAGVGEAVSPAALLRAAFRGTPGLVLGEGGGALFLEEEGSARRRGRAALGRLLGSGFAFGPRDDGAGATGAALAAAARSALAEAGLDPEAVGCVVADDVSHADAEARRTLFGSRGAEVPVVTPARAFGHLLAGAPVAAVALATAILSSGTAPSGTQGAPRAVSKASVVLVLASGSAGGAAALVVGGPR